MARKKNNDLESGSKLRIRVQAYESRVLDSSIKEIIETINRLNIEFSGPIPLPTKIRKQTVNRAPFVFKDAREQFELKTHYRLLDIKSPTPQIVDALSVLSLPTGVSIDVQMVS